MSGRYEVTELQGWQSGHAHSSVIAGLSCHVVDTKWNRRLVATFRSEECQTTRRAGRSLTTLQSRTEARKRARELRERLNGRTTQAGRARALDAVLPDLFPDCPRCHDLSGIGAKRCESCGARLVPIGAE